MAKKKEEQTQATPETPEAQTTPAADEALQNLSVLADAYRVPTWQTAALCRMMGWQDGKMVTASEYADALARLSSRPVGGGRA